MKDNTLRPSLTLNGGSVATNEVAKALANKINAGARFADSNNLTAAERDVAAASAQLDNMLATLYANMASLIEYEKQLTANVKVTSGQLKQAAESMGQGVLRIEKAANFDRLEKYVTLLERAANAMTTLSELEKSGKLEKIASAIR